MFLVSSISCSHVISIGIFEPGIVTPGYIFPSPGICGIAGRFPGWLNSGILMSKPLGSAGISPSGRLSISLSGMNGAMPGPGAVGILGILGIDGIPGMFGILGMFGMLGIVGELFPVMKGMEGK